MERALGLSLVETSIAAALLLLVAVGVLPLFAQALASNLAGGESSWASNAARSAAEELFQLPFDHPRLTLETGAARVEVSHFSLADDDWKPGPEPPPGASPSPWRRTITIRQYSVAALDDALIDAGEALAFDADLQHVHLKEIEVEISGIRTAGPLGPSRRMAMRLLKSQ